MSDPRSRDFQHEKAGVALWIDGQPQFVNAEIAAMGPGSVPRNISSWNTVLSGYVKSQRWLEALDVFKKMQTEGVKPDNFSFVSVCSACASLVALEEGQRVHAQIIESGWESHVFVASSLLHMYAKCGSIDAAWKVFNSITTHDVVLWNTMLVGFSKCFQGQKTLKLYHQMQAEEVKPNIVTFVAVLNACASSGAVEEGRHVHLQVIQSGCESDVRIGNGLVNMYVKFGLLDNAWRVFCSMPAHNVVSWTTIITGYVKSGQQERAWDLYRHMQVEGLKPNTVTFKMVLSACARSGALEEGRLVHKQVIQSGCESDVLVGSAVIDMYAKCGSLDEAWRVFHTMPIHDVVSWNAMLAGCVKCEQGLKALDLYKCMQKELVNPNIVTFTVVLNACAMSGTLQEGRHIHGQIIKSGLESDVCIRVCLLGMYAKCGSMDDAWSVFHRIHSRDVVAWTALLAGLVKCEQGKKALELYQQMQAEGVQPNTVTFTVLLNACASLAALDEGRRVHKQVVENSCESDVFIGSSLVHMYTKCGSIDEAWMVFSSLPYCDVMSWNVMLSGYVYGKQPQKAVNLYWQMQGQGVNPNTATFSMVLNGCATLEALEEGRHVHALAIQSGFESDIVVGSALVDMYAKCGFIDDARRVFNTMPTQDVVSWTSMLAGYVTCKQGWNALQLYQMMQTEGVSPNAITLSVILHACAISGALQEGRAIHSQASQAGWESDVFVGNALVDMYAKCGSIDDALAVFNGMPIHDVVSWNAILVGCVECEQKQLVLELYRQMQKGEVEPNAVTLLAVLSACASLAALEEGKLTHGQVIQAGLESDVLLGSTLVDMYAKCGCIDDAWRVFNAMPTHDVVSLNAMLGGLAMHGCGNEAMQLFDHICKENLEIDTVTFVSLLSACSHAGLVEEGLRYFEWMHSVYGISPTVTHYVCLVDLLGRADRLKEAEDKLKRVSCDANGSDYTVALMALLGACRNHAELEWVKE